MVVQVEALKAVPEWRSPVNGTSGGWPARLQVACKVESWRKLASPVKISAQFRERAFF
jgi:hypothetical protein